MSTITTQSNNTICIFSESEAIYITKTGWNDYHVIYEYGDTGETSYRRMSEFELNEKYGIVANVLLLNNTNDTRAFN